MREAGTKISKKGTKLKYFRRSKDKIIVEEAMCDAVNLKEMLENVGKK